MRIGIIGAMQMEVDTLKESLENISTETISGVEFVSGTFGDKEIVAAVCGVGKVFAAICAQTMILKYNVDQMINIGVGGTLTRDLSVLDVALATQVVQHDMDTSPLGDPVGLISGINQIFFESDKGMVNILASCMKDKGIHFVKGTIATGDQFLENPEKKASIREMFQAIACEMEGGSIGHVCFVNNVPFAILRSISDGDGGAIDYQTFAEKAAVQSIDVVIEYLNRI
ncbi:MAG: 5'-methylthioadenosine/adenosylhomocysteine nucleosidase [Agathobacter sp.]|nr:5'-methylthioadenosine/adenosylhomocysteine nucleosidase [Agathobacter sp.]